MSTATNPTSSERKFKTVRFYTTKYVLNLTRAISQMLLRELKILTADIVCDTPITFETVQRNRAAPTELLFILIPQLLVTNASALPDPGKYCIYQLEQLNDKNVTNSSSTDNETLIKTQFNPTFMDLLQNSATAFDYSSVNLNYYPASVRSKVAVLPPPVYVMPAAAPVVNCNAPCNSDILFYGSLNPRRERILSQLAQAFIRRGYTSYNIRTVSRLFGEELLQYVARARIVLNIHFYANSILETDRIHTALQFNNVTVISECPTQRDALLPAYEANPRILFCEEICDNVDELTEACIKVLLSVDEASLKDDKQANNANTLHLNELCAAELKRHLIIQ